MDNLEHLYRDALVGRIVALKAAQMVFEANQSGAAASIKEIAHMLKGSGGTYGFPEITTAAAALEHAPEEQLLTRLDELLVLMEGVAVGRHRSSAELDRQRQE